jgi:hypothetical protein
MKVKTMTPEEFRVEYRNAVFASHYISSHGDWPKDWSQERYDAADAELLARLRSEEAGRKWAKEKQDNFDTRLSYPLNLAGELLAAMDQARDKS